MKFSFCFRFFDLENLPYCPPVIEPEPRHWYAVEVTHVKSAGEFYIRYPFGIDTSLGQGNERMYLFVELKVYNFQKIMYSFGLHFDVRYLFIKRSPAEQCSFLHMQH